MFPHHDKNESVEEYEKRLAREAGADSWQTLTGEDFEEFLASHFKKLGYDAETTKASGDQGVDLIVTIALGIRLAVQVKGGETVIGNQAVQEVYAGMRFYNCNTCAVITNSIFTKQARSLAEKVGCILLDNEGLEKSIAEEKFPSVTVS